MSKPKKCKSLCAGCRDDFYNGQGAEECWGYKTAKVVKRFRIHWWTEPTKKNAFNRVWTLSCYHVPGQYGFYEKLPDFVKQDEVTGEF